MPDLGFKPYRHPNGTPPIRLYKHSASDASAIAAGDAVIIDGTYPGYVKIALSTSGQLLGVAQNGCAASVLGDVYVYDDPETEFTGTSDGTTSQALINTDVDIIGATGAMYVDQGETTEQVIHINELYDPAGADGRVVFKIHRHEKAPTPVDA